MEELQAVINDISTEVGNLYNMDPNNIFWDNESRSEDSSLISVDFNISQLEQELEDNASSAGEENHSLNKFEFNNSGQNSVKKRKLARNDESNQMLSTSEGNQNLHTYDSRPNLFRLSDSDESSQINKRSIKKRRQLIFTSSKYRGKNHSIESLSPPLTKAPQSSLRPVTSIDLNQTYPSPHTSSFSTDSTSSYKQHDFKSRRYSSPLQKTHKQHELIAMPMFQNYQLLGDSQLVRFSQQVLRKRSVDFLENSRTRRIGYCVSGQKIDDLKYRLQSQECKLANKVIMMIGTNDFVQRTMFNMMCKSYTDIVNFLKKKVDKIVLLTVPPVARLQHDKSHWSTVERFNKFIEDFEDRKKVFVVDVAVAFTSYNSQVCKKYFESVFQNSSKVDMVHLNKDGLHLLKSNLEALYFRKYSNV